MWWIGYAKARHEFAVADAIRALGIRAECPRKITVARRGYDRRPSAITEPYLGNYVFIQCDDTQWHQLSSVKHLAKTLRAIPDPAAARYLIPFVSEVEADYAARIASIEAGERVQEYQRGDVLQILAGPLAGQLATFRRVIEGPRIVASIGIFGGKAIETTLDPLHARRSIA